MNLQLQNKTVFVTGSTAGFGFATAKQVAAQSNYFSTAVTFIQVLRTTSQSCLSLLYDRI